MVLLEVQKIEDVSMPGLDVHCKGPLALATTLVHIPCGVVEDTQHRHKTIAMAVGATNVASSRTDLRDGHTNATSTLGDHRALLERPIDTFNAVTFHFEQEARRHLRAWGACIEECWRRMCEVPA